VTSYPTLKFFKLNSNEESIKYRSSRDLPSLTQFINDQLGSSIPPENEGGAEEPVEIPSPLKGLVDLNDKNFASSISTGNWFVKFFAPW
jgi:thioredoxin domain-containing protein 5